MHVTCNHDAVSMILKQDTHQLLKSRAGHFRCAVPVSQLLNQDLPAKLAGGLVMCILVGGVLDLVFIFHC